MTSVDFTSGATEPIEGEGSEAPPVVAVVVASDPGEHFAEMLSSLGNQDYDNLSVLVVDAGSAEPIADRVAEVLPEAYLHRLTGDPGWSVAANQSIELVSGSPFLLFCHDDVVLDERCVSALMSELYRQNAGIAGPKLVDWDDPRKMLQLGMGSDRFGVLVEQVERGEFDQEQYDPVREVFVAPGGVQLVRSDLFVALGGFDPAISLIGEDLDLCWRARVMGARVLAVSAASARHRETMDERMPLRERRKLSTRHRLRTVMVNASGRSRFTSVPLAMALIVIEALYYLLTGRRGQARDSFSAIAWNLTRLGEIRRRQRALAQVRQKPEKEVRALQMGGSAALANFSRGQFTSGQDRFSGFLESLRSSFQGEDSGSLRDATVLAAAVILFVVFGSRHLLTRGVVAVGQIPIVPPAGELFQEFWSGWRSTGTGGPGNPPSAFLLLGLARSFFFWGSGLFDTLLLLAPVAIGIAGTYRLVRPLGSARSAAVAGTFYAVSPLVMSMFSAGRWDSLVVYAAAPYLIGSALRIDGAAPYGNRGGIPGWRIASRSLPVLLIRYGILVAVVAAFVPAVIVVAVLITAILAVGAVLAGQLERARELAMAGLVAVIAPVSIHLPWSYDQLRWFSWRWLIGPSSAEAGSHHLLELIQFAPGGPGASILGLALPLAAMAGLAIARPNMLGFALRGWLLALALIGLVWATAHGWIPVDLPAAEILMAPAAVGLALAVTTGVRAIELDEAERPSLALRFGQAATWVALAAGGLAGLQMTFPGNWDAPPQSYAAFTTFLSAQPATEGAEMDEGEPSRVLWIGDPSVVPVDVTESDGGVAYAVTDGGLPEVWGRWSAGPVGRTAGIGEQLDLARAGQTVRLGRLLAPYGISIVIVVEQLAPAPYEGPRVPPSSGVVRSLSQQLDLERIPGFPDLIVFRNRSAAGIAAQLPTAEAAAAVTAVDQLSVDLSSVAEVPVERRGPGQWTLDVPGEIPVLFAVPNAELRLGDDPEALISGFDGLTVVPGSVVGSIDISYPVPFGRRLALVVQFVVVVIGVIVAQTRREVHL